MASSFAGLTAFAEDGNTVAAPTNTTGSVYVTIEKSAAYKQNVDVEDIDYILAPTKVSLATVADAMGGTDALTPDDGITDITILDVLLTVYGTDKITYEYRQNYNCYYVSEITDTISEETAEAAKYITSASDYLYALNITNLGIKYTTTYTGVDGDGKLSENDLITCVSNENSTYKGGSGWVIAQNNVGPYYGVSTTVANNDVLRMEWTSFNGMDIGYTGYFYDSTDTTNYNWTPKAAFFSRVNKDALVRWLVDESAGELSTKVEGVHDILKDITATQDDIDDALE